MTAAGTHESPYARVHSLGPGEVRWTHGFWADRFETCRQRTIPALWSIMEGTGYSHYYQNFRIAGGLAQGRHRGAPFNDGDFYKWLESACAVLAITRDAERERQIAEIVGGIGKAQRADGYIHTATLIHLRNGDASAQPFQSPLDFELYNMGHLFTAACMHHHVTGEADLLTVARKAAGFLEKTFPRPTPEMARLSVCPSHLMGLVDLYRATGEPRYLQLAKRFLDARDLITEGGDDDNQTRIPLRQQTEAAGHAVRANYLYAGVTDLFAETGDPTLWAPLERIWESVVRRKMYVTGGCGALYDGASPDGAKDQKAITRVHQAYGRSYQLPNLTAHGETCANIGNALWNWRMFLVTGEARFMDVVERTLYNSVLSGVSLDGADFFYVNPLRHLETMPVELRWAHTREPYFGSFCCPPNLARMLAQAGSYAYGKSGDAIWVNLYGSNTLTTKLSDGQAVRLAQETQYPWNGRIQLTVDECGATPFSLKLRIPGWASSASVFLNGQRTGHMPAPGTYLELRRAWQAGDVVELDIPMPPHLIEAHPLVEETVNQVAIQRGPLVYCMESIDLSGCTRLTDVRIPADIDLPVRYDEGLLGGMAVIEGRVLTRPTNEWDDQLYREFKSVPAKRIDVQFIPYYAWANRGTSEMSVWLPLHD